MMCLFMIMTLNICDDEENRVCHTIFGESVARHVKRNGLATTPDLYAIHINGFGKKPWGGGLL